MTDPLPPMPAEIPHKLALFRVIKMPEEIRP